MFLYLLLTCFINILFYKLCYFTVSYIYWLFPDNLLIMYCSFSYGISYWFVRTLHTVNFQIQVVVYLGVMINLDSILKSRDITLPTKVHLVKAMVFPVIMYGCELDYKESWAPKNWCFWTVVLEKTLESPFDWKEIQPVHPKEISPEYSLEGLMLKLKLQYFGYLLRRADSLKRPQCWERLKAGGEGDDRGWDGWMASLTQWTWVWVNSGSWWWTGKPGMLQSMGLQRVRHDWVTKLNWLRSLLGDKENIISHEEILIIWIEGLYNTLNLYQFRLNILCIETALPKYKYKRAL